MAVPRSRSTCAAVAFLLLAVGCASNPRFDGPLSARNKHPAQLTVGRLRPRSVEARPTGGMRLDWRNAYSSLFLYGESNGDSYEMDGELLRTSLSARVGLGGGVEVESELPFGHLSGGFLDDFVVGWHEAFSLPSQGRDDVPSNRDVVGASDDGENVYAVESHGLHLLDIPVILSWELLPLETGRSFGLLVRGGVELPTGDDDAGFGSGEPDWMVGAVGELRTGAFSWNAHVEHTWAGTPDRSRALGFEFQDVLSLGVGTEIALTDELTGLVQVEMDQSTLRQLDLRRASDDQWLIWTGVRARLGDRFRVEFGIGEDLSQYIAPDFTAWLSFSVDIGPR